MSPARPAASSTPPEERVVEKYEGVEIIDARDHVIVRFAGEPREAVGPLLRIAGFQRKGRDWKIRSNPTNCLEASAIIRPFYGAAKDA